MWVVENNTPFAAERCWVRDKNGAEVWLVAVRGTFLIGPDGETTPSDSQAAVCMAPEYRGDPASTSLLYDTDLVHKKLGTDVLLQGHVYAPGGKPATSVDATLKLGNINKTIRAVGDRIWEKSLIGVRLSEPKPFDRMPITYERAFGGHDTVSKNPEEHSWDDRNPVGRGFATAPIHRVGLPAPNIEDPYESVENSKRPCPAGFGPIPGHWMPRANLSGTYDATWERDRLPLLPDDFDERFYNCAPTDQQVPGFLNGGELVELTNLSPDGLLRFHLPRVTLRFTTDFGRDEFEYHRAFLHTVILEPDVPQVVMVWHTHLPCHHKVLRLTATRVSVLPRLHLSKRDRETRMWTGGEVA